jgi:DNA-binding MarR family transcriptional regulator
MQNHDAQSLAFGLLAASRALVDGISAGVRARGFDDVRPAHGFAFSRLSAGGATITQLAEHLDMTRQAAAQLVDELIGKGYVERRPHPRDARARLIVLTEKGWACTQAAEAAINETLRPWETALGLKRLLAIRDDLLRVAPGGPLRPTW